MKKIIALFVLSMAIAMPMSLRADDHPTCKQKKTPPDISTIVTDLTPAQKKKIDQISKEGNERIHTMEGTLRQVRDSIRNYMDAYDDNTKVLDPLFEREGKLETEINKEKYRTKNAINRVLTLQQHKQLVDHYHQQHGDKMKGKCTRKFDMDCPAPHKIQPAKRSEKK